MSVDTRPIAALAPRARADRRLEPVVEQARRVCRLLATESIVVATGAACVFFWAVILTGLLGNDSWMTLVGGREVVTHGIPHHNTLTLMTQGKRVVDQQWLAQVGFWEIFRLGGIRLALLATVTLLLAPVAVAMGLARRRGASATSIVPFALLPILDFSSILRAQLFSGLLFVVLLALLAAESRRPSRRVVLAFPLIVLWANLHGAALLGAGLVALLGLIELVAVVRRRPPRRAAAAARAGALLVVPWLCLTANPYGPAAAGYYKSIVDNPVLRQIETEWAAPVVPSVMGFAVFALGGATIALLAKRRRDLTGFELAVLAYTLFGALLAVRSIPWFAYSCLVLLPALLERSWRRREPQQPPVTLGFAVACTSVALAVGALTLALARPVSQLTPTWPAGAASAVNRVLREDPRARVFTSYEYPDWLLLTVPRTRGRLAYDGRFELLANAQLTGVVHYIWQIGAGWERPTAGYRLLVLNPQIERELVRTYDRRPSVRVLFRTKRVVVYDRGRAADRS
jgi:hypothetical protein